MLIVVSNQRTTQPTAPPVRHVLDYLGVAAAPPSAALLDALVAAYVRRVPWESASRIVRRATCTDTAGCPRWPVVFWRDAIQHGTGGTCFESNYAFFWLLKELGYQGYLTINDMGDVRGCHAALVIDCDGGRYLVDVGMPLYLPVALDAVSPVQRTTAHHTYTVTPAGNDRFIVTRDRHPRPDCYTLVDRPVSDAAYRAATTADYGSDGLFLDRVIVNRIVDGVIWRFSGGDAPYHLEAFDRGDKTYHLLGHEVETAAQQVAARFGLSEALLAEALHRTHRPAQV